MVAFVLGKTCFTLLCCRPMDCCVVIGLLMRRAMRIVVLCMWCCVSPGSERVVLCYSSCIVNNRLLHL